ncbi:hypothetical protein IWW50_005643 [Coemansia erecta]|nr:hypothetical protein GGF43_005210 [Coemansia sp. RSA 2618]KAJ2818926.1 hypothetical protein IWW50_005643 [Coemansia erecta]
MNVKCAISMLALTAAVINAAPAQTQHARKLDANDTINQISSLYNDPAKGEIYTSLALSFASNLLPPGPNPSSEDIYSVLVQYKDKIGSMILADELKSLDYDLTRTSREDKTRQSELSEYVAMLHDSSVGSRLADIFGRLVSNIIEDYETGKPTGSTEDDEEEDSKDTTSDEEDDEDDKDSKSNEDEDDKDTTSDKEETTSGATSTKAGMLLVSAGVVAGVMTAMF